MKNRFVNISSILENDIIYYAHRNGREGAKVKENETLASHTILSQEYFLKLIHEKNLDDTLLKIYNKLFDKNEYYDFFMDLISNVIAFHDLGKINYRFQNDKMDNYIGDIDLGKGSEHSIISAVLYAYYFSDYLEKIKDGNDKAMMSNILFICSFIILRHHSHLNDFNYSNSDYLETFIDYGNKKGANLNLLHDLLNLEGIFTKEFSIDYEDKIEILSEIAEDLYEAYFEPEKNKVFYILTRLIYSILLASDYYSTTEYMESVKTELPQMDIENFKSVYNNSELINIIRDKEKYGNYLNTEDMNDKRTEIFLEVEKNFENNQESSIYLLESPTGSGKSNIAMNLSYKLMDGKRKKILYAYPFNTLVEQNKDTIEQYYKDTEFLPYITTINSITEIEEKKLGDDTELDNWTNFTKLVLDRQFLHSPLVITTNVFLFKILFGNERKNIFSLYQLSNSVIVLDEIQAYNPAIWNEIIDMLDAYSELLNIKFIILSATLPDLSLFLDETRKVNVHHLVSDSKLLFKNKIFKNRVTLNFDLITEGKIQYERLIEHMNENIFDFNKILIEFISKTNAEEFYQLVCDEKMFNEYQIEIITGDDNLYRKKEIIDNIKKDIKVILIATQVVEAGVDIDMDMGYKDISILENEEQFLGRINRSNSKINSIVYFFDMADEMKIYRQNAAEYSSLRNEKRQNELTEKDFQTYYEEKIQAIKNTNKSIFKGYNLFLDLLCKRKYEQISKHMELINDEIEYVDIFLSRVIVTKNGNIYGHEVWENYKEILEDNIMDYSEKYVKLFNIKVKMTNFMYKIPKNKLKDISSYNDKVGNIFYFEDGEQYLEKGRLNLRKDIFGSDFI